MAGQNCRAAGMLVSTPGPRPHNDAMPRRRRVYIINIEDYLVDPPAPPSRAPRVILYAALGVLALANLAVFFGWLFSLVPHNVLETAIAGVFAYSIILALFFAISRGLNHIE